MPLIKPMVKVFRLHFTLVFLVFFSSLAFADGTGLSQPATGTETLTILYTNDTHSHLVPFDLPGFGKNIGGVCRREAFFRSIRASNRRVLILDGGDIFQGSPFYSVFKGEADVKAFSLCGYDATTLGNHDLDDGFENTLRQFSPASFPILSSNVAYAKTGKLVFPPFKVFDLAGVKVGIIGCIGKEAWEVTPLNKKSDLIFLDPVESVASISAALRSQADVVILLSHSGYDEDLKMAQELENVDLIIGGHTNTILKDPILVQNSASKLSKNIKGTLVLQAFKWGVFVGRLDLILDPKYRVSGYSGGLKLMDESVQIPENSKISGIIDGFKARIDAMTSQVIGHCSVEMEYSEVEKHVRDLPLGTFVCESIRESTDADFSIINSGAIKDRLPAGDLSMGHIISSMPFDNTVVTFSIDGEGILEMLNFICKNFGKITGYQYGGLTCTYDLVNWSAKDIKISGKPLELKRQYKLATISYLSDGNQNGNELFKSAKNKSDTGYLMRDMVIEFLRKHKTIVPPEHGRITLLVGSESANIEKER
ncbi:bifunctional metallophosphatase/5'-nucleotidase [bacterium]|nr:bifunctional metallophosphatase/5'-nucleotidase [bacterium]